MILVTGGAGFIGSVLVHQLNLQGRSDIIVVDRLGRDQKWLNLRGLKYHSYVLADELFTYLSQDLATINIKAIYHLGACSDTTEMDLDFLWKNNVQFSQKLFTYAADRRIPFLYASSAATYGDGQQGYNDDHQLIPQLRPLNPYGYSKQVFDEWVLKQKHFPRRWFGLKFFNVYGPHEYHKEKMVSVIYQAFQQIKEKGEVRLFKSHRQGIADGEQFRDFVYVNDVIKLMLLLMDESQVGPMSSGIYNMGTGEARTFRDLALGVFAAMGKEAKITYFDMPESLRKQYQYFTQAEMKKLQEVIPPSQFKFSSLEEGIKDYVQQYLAKENPYLES